MLWIGFVGGFAVGLYAGVVVVACCFLLVVAVLFVAYAHGMWIVQWRARRRLAVIEALVSSGVISINTAREHLARKVGA